MTTALECEERVKGIETLLVLPVTALNFSIMSGSIRASALILPGPLAVLFKKGESVFFAVGKTIGKLKSTIGSDASHLMLDSLNGI